MASLTEDGKHTPVMVISESAHRLAVRLARRGKSVVYRCKTKLDIVLAREEVFEFIRSNHWFQNIIMGAWMVNDAGITHRSGGTIIFLLYSPHNIGRAVELEVHV